MPRPQLLRNPFYLLLSLVGFVFVVTVCAYWLMSLAVIRDPLGNEPRVGLLGFLEQHGTLLIVIEVAALLVLCVAAMATDDFWMRRAEGKSPGSENSTTDEPLNPTPGAAITSHEAPAIQPILEGSTPDESHAR